MVLAESVQPGNRTLRALEWLNFFVADVQTGLGPFLAAYLAASGWNPARVGYALTFGGLVTVALQTPAGAVVDAARRKRLLVGVSVAVLAVGAMLLLAPLRTFTVYVAQFLIGGSAPFLAPSLAAITLGLVGTAAFDKQFGRNQAFNAAGNVVTALLVAYVSYKFGYRAIFVVPIALSAPAVFSVLAIDGKEIDYERARGSSGDAATAHTEGIGGLFRDKVLLLFLVCAFLFHLANAAMLPELGEMLAKGNPKAAAPFMSACVIVTQLVITVSATWLGKRAQTRGRKPLLLVGFGVLPIRGVLYTLARAAPALIGIQVLDGVANAIFGIVSILVIKDRTEGTGRFNLASGALATMVGIGAALSTTLGGVLVQRFGYSASFLGLAGVAVMAVGLLWVGVPETGCAQAGPNLSRTSDMA
ncbi:MFS transporter [Occallatibacter savannae]|uniref:MFS transporter n=1 Tax=Occallatibacter savannae TaxID=1002691 RepID=UPI000D69A68E|nr:MFS transporter [Occallatibacter savannae]